MQKRESQRKKERWNMELGIGFGTAIVLYFVTKWAVRNGICEAYERITGQEVPDCGETGQGEISQN